LGFSIVTKSNYDRDTRIVLVVGSLTVIAMLGLAAANLWVVQQRVELARAEEQAVRTWALNKITAGRIDQAAQFCPRGMQPSADGARCRAAATTESVN
jgi:hypothetical protein